MAERLILQKLIPSEVACTERLGCAQYSANVMSF